MKAYVGVTDFDWYTQLSHDPGVTEVNFWQPSGSKQFRALEPGELFLFKLHAPHHVIAGGGVFAHFSILPTSLAWDAFGTSNGARSLEEMRLRVRRYRRTDDEVADFAVGCIILTQTFFLPREYWIPVPRDWHRNIVQGKTYDGGTPAGRELFQATLRALEGARVSSEVAVAVAPVASDGYGAPVEVRPRLGQGAFRVVVTDAYDRRCAVSGERVLPVLEAAHIRPFASGGEHSLANGLLLRSDLHTLFDRGYVTVSPQMQFEVSGRIREDFENGRAYYALHGQALRMPRRPEFRPSGVNLAWHNERKYLG